MSTPEAGASCWICLDDGPDESGGRLVRDCSCRGGSAGFAHLHCLVKYAEQRTRQTSGGDPWQDCPNCRQPYQNDLSIAMADACLSFVEKNCVDPTSRIEAMHGKLEALAGCALRRDKKEDLGQIANEILSLSGKHNLHSERIQGYQASACGVLGELALGEGTKQSSELATKYFERSLNLVKKNGGTSVMISAIEQKIRVAKSKSGGENGISPEERLKNAKAMYSDCLERHDGDSHFMITRGIALASSLKAAHHGIEAERLLSKLAATSRRVNGPHHDLTKEIESILNFHQSRFAVLLTSTGKNVVEAIRWEDGGRKCLVRGPIAVPRNAKEEKTFIVASDGLWPKKGTPVVCHGLVKAPHLNGKIGDVRNLCAQSGRCEVYFEDVSLSPRIARVKLGNLQRLIDLPPK